MRGSSTNIKGVRPEGGKIRLRKEVCSRGRCRSTGSLPERGGGLATKGSILVLQKRRRRARQGKGGKGVYCRGIKSPYPQRSWRCCLMSEEKGGGEAIIYR